MGRDVVLRQTARQKPEHLQLPRRQTESVWVRRRKGPPKEAADACDQFFIRKWLHQVVVCAEHQPSGTIESLRALSGEKDHRDAVAESLAQPAADLISRDPWKSNI